MAELIFPTDFEEKTTIAQDDYVLFSDSEDSDKIKKAKYSHLKWETWTAATITVWSTATWAAWTSASVTNSWTSSAAVLDFTIPKWDKWDTGDTGAAWADWKDWKDGTDWASIVSWAFSGDDLVFTKDDWNTVTITDAKVDLKWDTWAAWSAATIAVWTVSTWAAWSSATVTNSGTSAAAVFDFSIPQWDKWDTWTAATITVWSTTTWWAGTSASVTNSGTSSAAVLNFTIPKWDKWDTGTAATISVWTTSTGGAWSSASVTNSGTSSAAVLNFTIPKWDKWDTGNTWPAWASIVSWAFSGDDLVFTKDDSNTVTITDAKTTLKWDKWDTGNTWSAWPTWNWISNTTSSKSWKVTTVTLNYTNWNSDSFQVSDWADWQWAWDVLWPSSSTDWHLVVFDWISWKLIKDWWAVPSYSASDFDIKDLTDSTSLRSTWSAKADTTIINDTAYANTWDWDTTHAPTKNAVYDKFETLWTASTKDTWTSAWNVPVLDSNWKLNTSVVPAVAITDTFTINSSSDLTWLTTAEKWDVAICPSENKTYILYAEPYSVAANWKVLPTPTWDVASVNSKTWVVVLDADDISDSTTTNKFVTETDKSTRSGKQDALTLPWSPTSWNLVTWWADNKTLVDWWAIPAWFSPSWTATTWYVVTKTAWWYEWAAAPVTSVNGSTWAVSLSIPTKTSDLNNDSWFLTSAVTSFNGNTWAVTYTAPVTSVNSNTWAVTVSEFSPTSAWTTWQVLTKTAWWYDWAAPTGWISNDTTWTTTTVTAIWAGTEAEYNALSTHNANTIYHIY